MGVVVCALDTSCSHPPHHHWGNDASGGKFVFGEKARPTLMPRVRGLAPGYKSRVINDAPIPQNFTVGRYEGDGFAIMVGDAENGPDRGRRCYTGGWTREDIEDIIEILQEALGGKFTDG